MKKAVFGKQEELKTLFDMAMNDAHPDTAIDSDGVRYCRHLCSTYIDFFIRGLIGHAIDEEIEEDILYRDPAMVETAECIADTIAGNYPLSIERYVDFFYYGHSGEYVLIVEVTND